MKRNNSSYRAPYVRYNLILSAIKIKSSFSILAKISARDEVGEWQILRIFENHICKTFRKKQEESLKTVTVHFIMK